jgi:hypothetical protein
LTVRVAWRAELTVFAVAATASVFEPAPLDGAIDNHGALLATLQLHSRAATTSRETDADVAGREEGPLSSTVQRKASGPVRSEIEAPPQAAERIATTHSVWCWRSTRRFRPVV